MNELNEDDLIRYKKLPKIIKVFGSNLYKQHPVYDEHEDDFRVDFKFKNNNYSPIQHYLLDQSWGNPCEDSWFFSSQEEAIQDFINNVAVWYSTINNFKINSIKKELMIRNIIE